MPPGSGDIDAGDQEPVFRPQGPVEKAALLPGGQADTYGTRWRLAVRSLELARDRRMARATSTVSVMQRMNRDVIGTTSPGLLAGLASRDHPNGGLPHREHSFLNPIIACAGRHVTTGIVPPPDDAPRHQDTDFGLIERSWSGGGSGAPGGGAGSRSSFHHGSSPFTRQAVDFR